MANITLNMSYLMSLFGILKIIQIVSLLLAQGHFSYKNGNIVFAAGPQAPAVYVQMLIPQELPVSARSNPVF